MKKYKFKATIQAAGGGGASVSFPYDVEKEFGIRGRVPVKATFNDVPYAGSLMKYGDPRHMLVVLKAIREQIGKGPGDMIDVVVWRDEEVRTLKVPTEFSSLMKKERLAACFETLSYSHRREYCRWIGDAKKEVTRLRRALKAVEMLKMGVKTPV